MVASVALLKQCHIFSNATEKGKRNVRKSTHFGCLGVRAGAFARAPGRLEYSRNVSFNSDLIAHRTDRPGKRNVGMIPSSTSVFAWPSDNPNHLPIIATPYSSSASIAGRAGSSLAASAIAAHYFFAVSVFASAGFCVGSPLFPAKGMTSLPPLPSCHCHTIELRHFPPIGG